MIKRVLVVLLVLMLTLQVVVPAVVAVVSEDEPVGIMPVSGAPNIGTNTIWRISHEEIPPTAGYVDVRLYLYQMTAQGTGAVIINMWYDSTYLSNPRLVNRYRIDVSRLTPGFQTNMYNSMRADGMTTEEILETGMFENARFNDAANHGVLVWEPPQFYPNHSIYYNGSRQNIIGMYWQIGAPGRTMEHVFVYWRFDVAPNLPVGTVADLRIVGAIDMTGAGPGGAQREHGSVTIIQDTFELEVSMVASTANPPTGMEVTIGGTPSTPAVGTHNVVNHTAVVLNAGTSDHQTFLGWMTQAEWNALPTNANNERYVPNFVGPINPIRTITMPSANEHMRAVWGNQDGIVSQYNDATLTITNLPTLTHSGQSATASPATPLNISAPNAIEIGTSVTLIAGGVTQNHYFLGWYRYTGEGSVTPASGVNINSLVQGNLVRPTQTRPNPYTGAPHTFDMPATNVQYFALWGARDVIGEQAAHITFRAYGVGSFNGEASIIVPVTFGQTLNLNAVETYLASEETAFAFWGWFTNAGLATGIERADLDAYGRRASQSDGVLRRRPAVGQFGFYGQFPTAPGNPAINAAGFTRALSFTEAQWTTLTTQGHVVNGSLDLHAIWSPWGDVDDNDAVNIYDLEALAGFLRFAYPRPVINMAPADVHRNGVVNVYDLEALAGFLRFAYPRPVLGARPTP